MEMVYSYLAGLYGTGEARSACRKPVRFGVTCRQGIKILERFQEPTKRRKIVTFISLIPAYAEDHLISLLSFFMAASYRLRPPESEDERSLSLSLSLMLRPESHSLSLSLAGWTVRLAIFAKERRLRGMTCDA